MFQNLSLEKDKIVQVDKVICDIYSEFGHLEVRMQGSAIILEQLVKQMNLSQLADQPSFSD